LLKTSEHILSCNVGYDDYSEIEKILYILKNKKRNYFGKFILTILVVFGSLNSLSTYSDEFKNPYLLFLIIPVYLFIVLGLFIDKIIYKHIVENHTKENDICLSRYMWLSQFLERGAGEIYLHTEIINFKKHIEYKTEPIGSIEQFKISLDKRTVGKKTYNNNGYNLWSINFKDFKLNDHICSSSLGESCYTDIEYNLYDFKYNFKRNDVELIKQALNQYFDEDYFKIFLDFKRPNGMSSHQWNKSQSFYVFYMMENDLTHKNLHKSDRFKKEYRTKFLPIIANLALNFSQNLDEVEMEIKLPKLERIEQVYYTEKRIEVEETVTEAAQLKYKKSVIDLSTKYNANWYINDYLDKENPGLNSKIKKKMMLDIKGLKKYYDKRYISWDDDFVTYKKEVTKIEKEKHVRVRNHVVMQEKKVKLKSKNIILSKQYFQNSQVDFDYLNKQKTKIPNFESNFKFDFDKLKRLRNGTINEIRRLRRLRRQPKKSDHYDSIKENLIIKNNEVFQRTRDIYSKMCKLKVERCKDKSLNVDIVLSDVVSENIKKLAFYYLFDKMFVTLSSQIPFYMKDHISRKDYKFSGNLMRLFL